MFCMEKMKRFIDTIICVRLIMLQKLVCFAEDV